MFNVRAFLPRYYNFPPVQEGKLDSDRIEN